MKKNHFFTYSKMIGVAFLGVVSFFLASCAQDGYDDDERFVLDTWNTKMVTPASDVITITSNATGDKQTIAWPLVKGAGGFEMKLEDITDPSAISVIYEGVVDGCSKLVSREDDTKYKLTLRALGNQSYGNTDADNTTTLEYSTFIESYDEIPVGDIAEYFDKNPLPAELADEEIVYDLVPGGEYTLSKTVDFGSYKVMLRGLSKTNRAKLELADGAYFSITAGLRLRAMEIDMSATDKALITGSATPDENIKGKTGTGDYYNITDPVAIQNCIVDGVKGNFIYDNNIKYCFKDLVIDNCDVHLTLSSTTNVNGSAVIYFKAGFANDLTIQNSTFWNTGDSDSKYFVQYNNSGRATRAGYTTNSVNFIHNTFYNVVKSTADGQFCNYGGFSGQGKISCFSVTSNIFVDCGRGQIARRILGGRTPNTYEKVLFGDNTYWHDGADNSKNESSYDNGYILTTDPAFVNAAQGDFTPQGAEQIQKQTGDPRWYVTN